MSSTHLTELSRTLTPFQKGKMSAVLRSLNDTLNLEVEKDLGASKDKKRLVHFSGKKLKKLVSVVDDDRKFLERLIELLQKESVLTPTGAIVVESNEMEEEKYGRPISVIFPADFEQKRRTYEQSLEKIYQDKVRASIQPPQPYQEPAWYVRLLTYLAKGLLMVVFVPLYLGWSGLKIVARDLWGYVYKALIVALGGFLLYKFYERITPYL